MRCRQKKRWSVHLWEDWVKGAGTGGRCNPHGHIAGPLTGMTKAVAEEEGYGQGAPSGTCSSPAHTHWGYMAHTVDAEVGEQHLHLGRLDTRGFAVAERKSFSIGGGIGGRGRAPLVVVERSRRSASRTLSKS